MFGFLRTKPNTFDYISSKIHGYILFFIESNRRRSVIPHWRREYFIAYLPEFE